MSLSKFTLLFSALLAGCLSTDPGDPSSGLLKSGRHKKLVVDEDLIVNRDLDTLFYSDSLTTAHVYAIQSNRFYGSSAGGSVILSGSRITATPPADFNGTLRVFLVLKGGSGDTLRESSGRTLVDTLSIEYIAVNDPPRVSLVQKDTAIFFLDSLKINVKKRFYDPDNSSLQYKMVADVSSGGFSVKDSLIEIHNKGLLTSFPVKILAYDGALYSDTLSFRLSLTAPAPTGRKFALRLVPMNFQDTKPLFVCLEKSERKTFVIADTNRTFFMDSRGVLKYPPINRRGGTFQRSCVDHTVFYVMEAGPNVDTMAWVTETTQGLEAHAFAFDPAAGYNPIGSDGGSGILFLHNKPGPGTPSTTQYFISRYSGGSLSDVAQLSLPANATGVSVIKFGTVLACFWSVILDSYSSNQISVQFFSTAGASLSVARALTTYSAGSKTGYPRNFRRLLDAIPFNGRLEIFHSSVNLPYPQTSTLTNLDQALYRTVIDAGYNLVLNAQQLPQGVPVGFYGDVYPMHWNPLDGSSYRIYWGNMGSVGAISTVGSLLVNANTNTYGSPVTYTAFGSTNLMMDFQFSDGNIFQLSTTSDAYSSGQIIPHP